MTTSSDTTSTQATPHGRVPLRLRLRELSTGGGRVDGVWWPQSRDLQTEAADLVDHFPETGGRISRLLFSRPDWDDALVGGRGARRVHAARGEVKVGSFPSDDTQLMILTLATGQRLRLAVVPSDTDGAEAELRLDSVDEASAHDDPDAAWAKWDDAPGF